MPCNFSKTRLIWKIQYWENMFNNENRFTYTGWFDYIESWLKNHELFSHPWISAEASCKEVKIFCPLGLERPTGGGPAEPTKFFYPQTSIELSPKLASPRLMAAALLGDKWNKNIHSYTQTNKWALMAVKGEWSVCLSAFIARRQRRKNGLNLWGSITWSSTLRFFPRPGAF